MSLSMMRMQGGAVQSRVLGEPPNLTQQPLWRQPASCPQAREAAVTGRAVAAMDRDLSRSQHPGHSMCVGSRPQRPGLRDTLVCGQRHSLPLVNLHRHTGTSLSLGPCPWQPEGAGVLWEHHWRT